MPKWMRVSLPLFLVAAAAANTRPPLLKNAFREDRGGWIFVHLEGTPSAIGFQHGYLLAPEIDETLRMFAHYLKGTTRREWPFYREAAGRIFWPRLEKEYQDEIQGIVQGMKAQLPGKTWDAADITALNGWIELAQYYVPLLDEKERPGSGDLRAPGRCSAFIATGSWTADGRIVMGHNNWSEYIVGERWNVILDVKPKNGHPFLMDAMPGYIHSGDDFVMNDAGLLYTETTISCFKGFAETGVPEFARARKAAQYAASIDDFVRIMLEGNNGGYANDWLVGDLKTNEIARLELGLKNHRVWRTRDGYYVGANFPLDEKLIAEETTFNPRDASLSVLIRKRRWEQLMEEHRGRIDGETGKAFEADHVDAADGRRRDNGNTLCGHVDSDSRGLPEFIWGPFTPGGAVQGKVTTAALAKELKMWARMGHPCGGDFLSSPFLAAHPQFTWQGKFLRDMKSGPWTLFGAKK